MYLRHFDDLSTTETEFLVVIQNCVHALNPQSVHWAIEHEPLLVRSVIGHSLSYQTRYDTISPIQRENNKIL